MIKLFQKILIISLLLLLLIPISLSDEIPQFLLFQGGVKIDGRDIATIVNFSIDGEEVASSDVINGEYYVMIQDYPDYYGMPIDIFITPPDGYEEEGYEAEQEIYYVHPQDVFLNLTALTEKALKIIDYSPGEREIIVTEAGDLDFSITAYTGYEDEINYKWYLDGNLILQDLNFYTYNINNYDEGTHTITIIIDDDFLTRTKEWTLIIGKPIVDDFDGDTTDFSSIPLDELENVEDVVFEKSINGKIEFLENLNLSGVYDIENTVKIENGIVAIDTSTYDQFKEPARITLRNLNYNSIPKIFYNEGFTLTNINQECDFCELIDYTDFPTINGEVIFEVDHFSSFTIKESGKIYDLDLFTELDICEIRGNLEVKIKEPDNNDDFKFGENIEIEVEVENNNEEDLDIIVEAILYNINEDDEIEKVESKDIEINDNDDETFELSLEVPKNFDENDDYILFVKAYEEDNEEGQCNYDLIDLDLEKEKHEVIINEVKIMPEIIPEGGSFKAIVEIENIGRKDIEDVYVKLKNEELGINLETDEFELEDDEIKTISFIVMIPEDSEEKDYELEASVYFDNKEDSKEGKLSVKSEDIVKKLSVYEEIGLIKLNLLKRDVLKEFIENIKIPEIPSYLHTVLFLIVVGLALGVVYRA